MNPVQIVAQFLNGFITYLRQKRTDGQIADAMDMIEAVNNWVARVITALAGVFYQELGSVRYNDAVAQKIGNDMRGIEQIQEANWNNLFDTILPNSLKHAYGVAQQWAIGYFSPPITDLYNHINDLNRSRATDEDWLYNWVIPTIRQLLVFRDDFFKGDQPAINVLNDWLAHPGHFGDWAAAPITGPLIAYLADDAHELSRDNLTGIVGRAWSEKAERTWEEIEAWLGANT